MIKYDRNKMVVSQLLYNMSLCSFEGAFEEAFEKLREVEKSIIKDCKKGKRVYEHGYDGWYIDGTKEKVVKFDTIEIRVGSDYEGKDELQVWGTRELLEEEIAAIKEQDTKQAKDKEERDKKEFERMKKEHGWS